MPNVVKDLQRDVLHRENEVLETVRKLKESLSKVNMSTKGMNEYIITYENMEYSINDLNFKQMYLIFLNNKQEIREWEGKWTNILGLNALDWQTIWQRQNNIIHSPYVRSALWEMTHLNFWSVSK